MWEFGPGLEVGHRLVITPEEARHLRPLVDAILEKAPSISSWTFCDHRLPESLDQAEATVYARTGHGLMAESVDVSRGKFNRIDVAFGFPGAALQDQNLAFAQAFIATEALLGEDILNTWLGFIDVRSELESPVPVSELSTRFHNRIHETQASLPQKPYSHLAENSLWTLYKLEPTPAKDYPAQSDMFVGKSAIPGMWQNAHCDIPFSSKRFSNCGEVFCYVKLDGAEGIDEEKSADKSEIEEAIDETLMASGLGCCVGGGTGLRYSYIDLAVTDIRMASDALRKALRAGNVPKRSWILFFDDEWHREWVGVWDDSPSPPLSTR